MRIGLKLAILQSGQSPRQVSLRTRIPESRLSCLVRGRAEPTTDERQALQACLQLGAGVRRRARSRDNPVDRGSKDRQGASGAVGSRQTAGSARDRGVGHRCGPWRHPHSRTHRPAER